VRISQRALLVAASVVVVSVAAVACLRRWLFAVEVAGQSMEPAFEAGDYVLVRRGRVPGDTRAAGVVVCMRGPDQRLLLKRVVGLPGDSLRIGTRVQVGGRALDEPYAHGETPPAQFRGVHELAPDEYLVLGDNRAASTDSRDFGPVRAEHIEGIAWLRYWPPERLGFVQRARRRFADLDADLHAQK
jgi:signal peptidase I